ncbi:MAG: hypothetical protein R3F56_00750 [Planctomycetota bacterium]
MTAPDLVRRIALDTLQRNPTPAEVSAARTQSPVEVARSSCATLEATQVWLDDELLYFLLIDNFRPTTEAIRTLPQRLLGKSADIRSATAEILLSSGFSLRNPGNDTFVTVVLEQCLGLEVQDRRNEPVLAAGKRVYDGYETRFLGGKGKTQADVVKLALADRRFAAHLLDRHHRRLFAAPLPKDEAASVDIVHAQPGAFFDVLVQWLGSERYADPARARRPLSHHQFARSLYHDLLGRAPTYDELRMVRNALLSMADPAPLRAVLVKIVLDSGRAKLPAVPARQEGEAFVRTCFTTFLRREPTADEIRVFTDDLWSEQTPSAVPLVRTLLGAADYLEY